MKKTKTDLQIKKDKIRKEILAKRNILSDKDINEKSDLIIKNLASYIENVQNIMIFMDMKTEVKITKLLELYPKKNFFISKITNSKNREMKINKYNKNELILHKFGYYDTFLEKVRMKNNKALFIGVCYDFQIIDSVPTEKHDVTLDFVVSENKIII